MKTVKSIRDYYRMVPAILSSFSFMAMMATVHVATPQERKHFSLTGLGFAMIGALLLSASSRCQSGISWICPISCLHKYHGADQTNLV